METLEISKDVIYNTAIATGDWMLRNQVTNRMDANRGRGLQCFDLDSGYSTLTASWQTGIQCMCYLALYRRTGQEKYLQAAEFAGRYIISLQIMDPRDRRYYGAIRELTPQSIEFTPRDATTAAWALVWLYKATENPLYLDRAVLFGLWHLENAMSDGWPLYAIYMDPDISDMYWGGSFQSGTGLFYHDLFLACGEAKFISQGFRPIANNYRDHFFMEDGKIIQHLDWLHTKKPIGLKETCNMHLYNDDFGNAMLQTAADFFKDESYREAARKNTRWLASEQHEDGGFDEGAPSGVPVSLMYFHDLGKFYNDQRLIAARNKGLRKLLQMQVSDTQDPRLDGAFRGLCGAGCEGPDAPDAGSLCVNNRTTGYALMALLKLESDLGEVWLSRHNKPFVDPLESGKFSPLVW